MVVIYWILKNDLTSNLIKEVLRVCMIQKMVKNADHHEKVPISYRLSTIDSC